MLRYLHTLLLILIGPLLLHPINAQTQDQNPSQEKAVTYRMSKESNMEITGTSSIHDWEAAVKTFDIKLKASPAISSKGSIDFSNISKTSVSVPVGKIKSGKDGMDSRIYDALKKDDHPNITFKMNSVSPQKGAASGDTTSFIVSGDLTIAGNTRSAEVDVKGWRGENGALRIAGSKKIDMTQYEVEPPSAMFGTIKAGKEVTVHFDLFVEQQ